MGCNYYLIKNRCDKCGRHDEPIHLGKASMGWKFSLQANDYKAYSNWDEMKMWLSTWEAKGGFIEDEYGDRMTLDAFIKMVVKRQKITDPVEGYYNKDMKIIDGYKFINCYFS